MINLNNIDNSLLHVLRKENMKFSDMNTIKITMTSNTKELNILLNREDQEIPHYVDENTLGVYEHIEN